MAPKKKKDDAGAGQEVTHVTFVAKAGMWCKTVVSGNNQTQTWSQEKP